MTDTIGTDTDILVEYTLRLGDDALILTQRLSEWIANSPQIEEDIAVSNVALDLLGQARALLAYAGEVEGAGRSEDDLAFLREEREFRNLQLVERPNGDFASTMARQLAFSTYQLALYGRLTQSADPTLAAVAGKAVKEVAYHREHAALWVERLGDGTEESHRRMQSALERIWPYTAEMFVSDAAEQSLVAVGVAVDSGLLRPEWDAAVDAVLAASTLVRPSPGWTARGGRSGVRTEAFGALMAEMQQVYRSDPGASW